ncbi:unnamed protein product [Cyclocybe aegerita]|uniref:DOMON domain-containing protein n=1 Tax=Cyclocybe aegerita TaxID=1973307 RepID=A0A8S0VYS4_CYCAE|nr:unnamed protein product [Cyclocybe aegerita]
MFTLILRGLLPAFFALYVNAQNSTQWCDSVTDICFSRYYLEDLDTTFGYLFPPLPSDGQPPSDEFIGIFIAPASTGWIGNSLGGGMRSNPLVIGWVNESAAVLSVRFGREYQPPTPLSGPVLTVLGTSGVNATRQRIVYRCQNCTVWTGGSNGITLSGNSMFGYAVHATIKPNSPSDPSSSLLQHTAAGEHNLDVANANTGQYAAYLEQLLAAGPISSAPPSTTTTAPIPTRTGELCPGAPAPTYSMVAAAGWRVTPVLGRLSSPRGITMDGRGNLLVLQRGVGVTAHAVDEYGCVTSSETVVADRSLNHAIEVNPAGDRIYASSSDEAWSWNYDPVAMTATNRTTLITGMHNDGHTTRTLLVSKRYPDYIMASVGSDGNIDLASFDPASGRAQIRVFDMRTIGADGVVYNTNGQIMGYGLRNDVGMAEDGAGIVHSVENSMDNAYRTVNDQQQDVHTDNPAEKVYRLGDPTNPTNLFGGYPYCYTVWEAEDFTDRTFAPGDWFVQDSNDTLTDEWCDSNAVRPTVLLPPHTAPLDMKFGVGSDTNLYVTLHGSWNRSPPQGYKVVVVPGQYSSTGEWSPSVGLAETKTISNDLLRNVDETQCQRGCFRPVGLVWHPSGESLYVTSDTSGEVFLLKRGSGVSRNRPHLPSILGALILAMVLSVGPWYW